MTQDERWLQMWQQYMDFMDEHKRRPSKYYLEEHKLYNWSKHNRKLINQNKFPQSRIDRYIELKTKEKKFQRINQHSYIDGSSTRHFHQGTVEEPVLDLFQ